MVAEWEISSKLFRIARSHIIPRHASQQESHAAGVGDTGEDQSGSDEA